MITSSLVLGLLTLLAVAATGWPVLRHERNQAIASAAMLVGKWPLLFSDLSGSAIDEALVLAAFADGFGLIWLARIAVRRDRWHPLVMAATALIATLCDALFLGHLFTSLSALVAMLEISCYILVITLWIGLSATIWRSRRGPVLSEDEAKE